MLPYLSGPPQPEYGWLPTASGWMPFSYPGPYGAAATAHTAFPTQKTPSFDEQQWAVPTNTAAPSHPQAAVAGYTASCASESLAAHRGSSGYLDPSQPGSMITTADQAWWWWWSWTAPATGPPPAHTRPLYSSIPLPTEDPGPLCEKQDYVVLEESPIEPVTELTPLVSAAALDVARDLALVAFTSKHTPSASSGRRSRTPAQPIRLHPTLESACQPSSSPSSSRSSSPAPSPPSSPKITSVAAPTDWAQDRNNPATTPSVGYLTLKISSTGQTIRVRPTSAASPHIVTVGDVFDAIEDATRTSERAPRSSPSKGRRSPRQIGERISTMLSSFQGHRTVQRGNRTHGSL